MTNNLKFLIRFYCIRHHIKKALSDEHIVGERVTFLKPGVVGYQSKKKKKKICIQIVSVSRHNGAVFFSLGLCAFLLLITVSLWTGDLILFSFIRLISTAIEMTHTQGKKWRSESSYFFSTALFSQPALRET